MSTYQVNVYTYLKNTDLHCVSAQEAITSLIGYSALTRLKRYGYWTISLHAESQEDANAQVESMLQNSYYIVNPNKEGYVLNQMPTIPVKEHEELRVVNVTQHIPFDDKDLIRKIKQKVGLDIQAVDTSRVWALVVDTRIQSRDTLDDDLTAQVINTSSRTQGLLVNPLYESFTFKDIHALSQTR